MELRPSDGYFSRPGKNMPLTFLLTSRIDTSQNSVLFSAAVAEDQRLRGYGAAQQLAFLKATGWEYTLRIALLHASQFEAALLSVLRVVPGSQQKLFFPSRSNVSESVDARHDQVCGQ